MEKYYKEATPNTPEVLLDAENGVVRLTGESRPENVTEFYNPLNDWLRKYYAEIAVSNDPVKMAVEFKLSYYNSSSSKCLCEFCKIIKEFDVAQALIEIYWFYDEGDDDFKGAGEELSKIVDLPFIFVENFDD